MGEHPVLRVVAQAGPDAVPRVIGTDAARAMIRQLRDRHGPLMFHQSGGCCDGSSPMCYPAGEFRTGAQDVHLGEVEGAAVFIGAAQHALWSHTQLIIDLVPGRGSGFSLEAPEGVRFLSRGRVFTEAEAQSLGGGS
jgi:uncharacterized protein (DUF779 family)